MESTNEVQSDALSIYECEQKWKEIQDDENAQLYRRYIVGHAFQLNDDGAKRRETHTGEVRPSILRRLWEDERKARAQQHSVTRLSVVETIEYEPPSATPKQQPAQAALPAWASGSPGNFCWADEEEEDLGIYATAGSKQRTYDVAEISDSEEEDEGAPALDQQNLAPAVDVPAEAPRQTNHNSPANASTNFTLDADDIECQLLEDPDAFKAYIKDLNTKLQLIISSTSSAEQTTKQVLEQAEDAHHKCIGEQAAVEKELRKQLATKDADIKKFKEDLREEYGSKFETEIVARDTKIESLRAKIAEQRIVIEHNSNSNTDFHNKRVAEAVQIAEEQLSFQYSFVISGLKESKSELKTAFQTLKEESEHIFARLKATEEKLSEARAFLEDYETAYADLRGDKERLEAQFDAERQNLTHLERVNEELEFTKESELAAAHQKHQEEMAGTRAATEKEIAAIRGEMKDLKDEVDFKDEQLLQRADLTISEVELKEKVQDLEAQMVEKDQQAELHAKLEEEKNTAVTERDELQAQLTTLKEQLAVQAQAIDQNNQQLEAYKLEKQTLQAEVSELQNKVTILDNDLTISFIQAEELAGFRVGHKKAQDQLEQARARELATTSAMHVPTSERMQNLKEKVTKMRTALENRPAPYVCKYRIKTEAERRAELARLIARSL